MCVCVCVCVCVCTRLLVAQHLDIISTIPYHTIPTYAQVPGGGAMPMPAMANPNSLVSTIGPPPPRGSVAGGAGRGNSSSSNNNKREAPGAAADGAGGRGGGMDAKVGRWMARRYMHTYIHIYIHTYIHTDGSCLTSGGSDGTRLST